MPEFSFFAIALYGLPVVAVVVIHIVRRMRRNAANAKELAAAVKAGLTEPVSLHPIVDPSRCVGSGACVTACPESALGIIDGKAQLTNPAVCIGHGACAAACPVRAITLVFGSERRGVDIPRVNPNFETNVPGIFIAGELGGMGLIRKAAEQGKQAIETIAARKNATPLDVLIIGAGPAGIASGLGAISRKLRYRLIEQEPDLGGAILHYPRNKIAMTSPVDLPIVGRMAIGEISKEELLATWQDIVERSGLKIDFGTRMERLERTPGGGFRVETTNGIFEAANVLLAIGRRGTPRKLDVPGEELSNVVYRLIEPEQYRGKRVLVVGGGDSAVECALACSTQPGTTVVLAYRGEVFNRIKPANRERLEAAGAAGRVDIRLRTEVSSVALDHVVLVGEGSTATIPNDVVLVQAGGVLPTALLKELGVAVETKYGTA